jgi:hypothetical protein
MKEVLGERHIFLAEGNWKIIGANSGVVVVIVVFLKKERKMYEEEVRNERNIA